jgi:hypothetical protein
VPIVERHLPHRPATGNAGVVHDEVDATEQTIGGGRHVLDLPRVGDVDDHGRRVPAGALDQTRRLLAALLMNVGEQQARPLLREPQAERASEPAAGTGDDCAVQGKRHRGSWMRCRESGSGVGRRGRPTNAETRFELRAG